MTYSQGFFDLQLDFAYRVGGLSGAPAHEVLLRYTNLYVRFGLGRGLDPDHPVWQEYTEGLRKTRAPREWTYRFYLDRAPAAEAADPPGVLATAGCFSYALLPSGDVRLHFRNADTEGGSSLGAARRAEREAELATLFGRMRGTVPEDARVVGLSWLYNLDAYRRLFPTAYASSARAASAIPYHSLTLWGQFLDRHGQTKEAMIRPFRERVARLSGVEQLPGCFPFAALTVEAPVSEFLSYYGTPRP